MARFHNGVRWLLQTHDRVEGEALNKTEQELARAEQMGWRVFNKARVQLEVYDLFKRHGWPISGVFSDSHHNRDHVNDRYNEGLLRTLFASWEKLEG